MSAQTNMQSRAYPYIRRVLFRTKGLDVMECGHTMAVRTVMRPNDSHGARICLPCIRKLPPVLSWIPALPQAKVSTLYWENWYAIRLTHIPLPMTRVQEILRS